MGPVGSIPEDVAALDGGRGFVDRRGHRKVLVAGADAARWLNDLLTAGIAELRPGEASRSLLLAPTGHVRADVHVLRRADGFLLVQDPVQPTAIDVLLAPYVLSSDVAVTDASDRFGLFCLPGVGDLPASLPAWRPSMLGSGIDLLSEAGPPTDRAAAALRDGLIEVGEAAVETWRILRGDPRFGADFDERSLPSEAGLGWTIDTQKGCFLGQESVARVRNLGHPPRVLLALLADGPVEAGTTIRADDREVGTVTSAAAGPRGVAVLASVRWGVDPSRGLTAGPVRLRTT